jgi:hypothetical protein
VHKVRFHSIIFLTGFMLLGLASSSLVAQAQAGVQIIDAQAEYIFGEKISFEASIQFEEPIRQVTLFIRPEGQTDTQILPAVVVSDGRIQTSYDLNEHPLRVFSHISYWYQVELQNGETYESSHFNLFYEDNRFDWETLEQGPFHVHWYSGDVAFAQDVLNTAMGGLTQVQSILPLSAPEMLDIYVYRNTQDMQASLRLSGQNWIAGHADPDLGVIMVSLPPGPEQQLEMERQIPHELMHVMLYQSTGNSYNKLPAWFIEGLASISELYPNPDYLALLENANENSSLIPITALCKAFPTDAPSALLAYAEAASFTRYLYNQFGTPGLEDLRTQYAAGVNCERGAEQALGTPLNRLESQWRRDTFANKALSNLLKDLAPWVVLLIALLAAPLILILRALGDLPAREMSQPSSQIPLDRSSIKD